MQLRSGDCEKPVFESMLCLVRKHNAASGQGVKPRSAQPEACSYRDVTNLVNGTAENCSLPFLHPSRPCEKPLCCDSRLTATGRAEGIINE